MGQRITRLAAAVGCTLVLGAAFVPLGCESWDSPTILNTHPRSSLASSSPDLPESIVQQLTACVAPLPGRTASDKPVTRAMQFGVQVAKDGRVRTVILEDATLRDSALEACMTGVLQAATLPLRGLPLRVSAASVQRPLGPEGRAFAAFPAPMNLGAAFSPVVIEVIGLILVVVVVIYAGQELVSAIDGAMKAAPAAVATTTAASAARRYPNQTCENTELDALEEAKEELCKGPYAAQCAASENKKKKARTPCSAIKRSIEQRKLCLSQRKLIEDKCFGGIPDKGHRQQIEQVQQGIDGCDALKVVNCAEGHPMAGL
jgi:Novel toxin 16